MAYANDWSDEDVSGQAGLLNSGGFNSKPFDPGSMGEDDTLSLLKQLLAHRAMGTPAHDEQVNLSQPQSPWNQQGKDFGGEQPVYHDPGKNPSNADIAQIVQGLNGIHQVENAKLTSQHLQAQVAQTMAQAQGQQAQTQIAKQKWTDAQKQYGVLDDLIANEKDPATKVSLIALRMGRSVAGVGGINRGKTGQAVDSRALKAAIDSTTTTLNALMKSVRFGDPKDPNYKSNVGQIEILRKRLEGLQKQASSPLASPPQGTPIRVGAGGGGAAPDDQNADTGDDNNQD